MDRRKKGITVIVDLLILTASILIVSSFWIYLTSTNYSKSVETHTLEENIRLIILSIDKSVDDAPMCTNINIAIPKGYNITFYQPPQKKPLISIINWGASPPSSLNLRKLTLSLKKKPYVNVISHDANSIVFDRHDSWFFNITFNHKIKLVNNQSITYRDPHLIICSKRGEDGTVELSFKR